ncbi:phenoloxidase-activating enzyme isoform X2 [Manduca sexta]|nr:phenoloxidase-activating enzyme isoform X2 [Manduca sexta]XP_037300123.1 phenoloxidase-activating enzyme isoform X2 [Manduca sexta]XP_037300134.1 phenoloxidase-activating enzyme isoform X2 [Manduca sexta]XP_037300137.1 phenoloxidase-activating enzyme isoform X2 [Manduca sexta]XP_037300145.1 phenoloxidase-activating enzyme isoform X2 [Manduca sexta]XP_037300154.1 phenoloxidase-activating enzyme isoform X2 [Manduca sexta]XP_037300156.1 phenoloxidase-activating enzyme isoform X2 [Manduca sext
MPKVCCPDTDKLSCTTPDGKKGQCVNIITCSNLSDLLKEMNDTVKLNYLKSSKCAGPQDYSVCCGPRPNLGMTLQKSCAERVSALPPHEEEDGCCGVDNFEENKLLATGGNQTFIDQYPWLVVIEYEHPIEKNKLMCGGALISGKYVLTAAHCVTGAILKEGTPKYVRLGEYNTTNKGPDCFRLSDHELDCTEDMILAPIEEIIVHPKYDRFDPHKRHDIALIRLKIYAPYTDFIRPICLPKVDYALSPPLNFTFFVAGWGLYFENKTKQFRKSEVKLHVEVPYVVRDQCQTAVRSLKGAENIVFRSGQICAGGVSGKDACRGDSGGPLMYLSREGWKFEVVGLVGAGASICGQAGIPGVYTYVYEYLPWIRQNMRH